MSVPPPFDAPYSAWQPTPVQRSSAGGGIDDPLYGATLPEAVRRFFSRYATFSGRASRSEFWWWTLVNAIVVVVLYGATLAIAFSTQTVGADGATEPGVGFLLPLLLLVLWELAILVPSYAIAVRRLHDANFSGWFVLLGLVPVVAIGYVVLTILPSVPEGRRFDRGAL